MTPADGKPEKKTTKTVVSEPVDRIIGGIRVPELPYPATKLSEESVPDWQPLLSDCWDRQLDQRVTHILSRQNQTWSVRQVNAAYLSDRIMDVFLKTSGLHPSLISRVARLRFWLAWRLNLVGAGAFSQILLKWLDSLQEWRGWSDTGGRSTRAMQQQFDALLQAVAQSFARQSAQPVEAFCQEWLKDAEKRTGQVRKLSERLLETEMGASRQRKADQVARALIGRALSGRQLPSAIARFILEHWYRVLKQSVWADGVDSELYRHANKLLEWLVWAGDPRLSGQDKGRLYHVGEQIEDRIRHVWQRAFDDEPPESALHQVQSEIVARVRGDDPQLVDALPDDGRFSWDSQWLSLVPLSPGVAHDYQHRWYVEGEGEDEQRRYFFALLEASQEVLWTNGVGARLGLEPWSAFLARVESGQLRPLPAPTPFGEVLEETVTLLMGVCEKQRRQREQAAQEARERAEALRRGKAEAERRRKEEEARRKAEAERQRLAEEQQRQADEQARQEQERKQLELAAARAVDGLGLGGWIAVAPEDGQEPQRLKLAVKIAASSKFVFVDRLGLNRREYRREELVAGVADGRIRPLGSSAEFDDTLSRVVGRIRVGRN